MDIVQGYRSKIATFQSYYSDFRVKVFDPLSGSVKFTKILVINIQPFNRNGTFSYFMSTFRRNKS